MCTKLPYGTVSIEGVELIRYSSAPSICISGQGTNKGTENKRNAEVTIYPGTHENENENENKLDGLLTLRGPLFLFDQGHYIFNVSFTQIFHVYTSFIDTANPIRQQIIQTFRVFAVRWQHVK